jgi:hypothetical protein
VVEAYSSWATAAWPTAVAHGGRGRAAVVAYGSRSPNLYKSRKLARKCHKNSKKRREGCEGEESEGAERRSSAGSSLHWSVFRRFQLFYHLYFESVISDSMCLFRSVVLKKVLFVVLGLRRRRGEVEGAEQ